MPKSTRNGDRNRQINATIAFEVLESRQVLSAGPIIPVTGGPYLIDEGNTLQLDGSGSSVPSGTFEYTWDLNGDGVFGDVTGLSPLVSVAKLSEYDLHDGPSSVSNARLRISDGVSSADSDPFSITVQNLPPQIWVDAPSVVIRTEPDITFKLSTLDPVDRYFATIAIDWDGDFVFDEIDDVFEVNEVRTFKRTFTTLGPNHVNFAVLDSDGGFNMFSVVVDVRVWRLAPNQADPSLTDLLYSGSAGDDFILILPGVAFNPLATPDVVGVLNLAEPDPATFVAGVTGQIVVWSQWGNDTVIADLTPEGYPAVTQSVSVHGGFGNDLIVGSPNADVLDGSDDNDLLFGTRSLTDGNDSLFGGNGSDVIFAGPGANYISGGDLYDLIVTGRMNPDFLRWPPFGILREWTTNRDRAAIIANIAGAQSGGFNGDEYIIPGVTVLDDGVVDVVHAGGSPDWIIRDFEDDTFLDPGNGDYDLDINF